MEKEVAIIRLEQLGPFPYNEFEDTIRQYNRKAKVLYVQEEHYNFGPYTYLQPRINLILEEQGFGKVEYEGRPICNQTSTGVSEIHSSQLREFLERSFK